MTTRETRTLAWIVVVCALTLHAGAGLAALSSWGAWPLAAMTLLCAATVLVLMACDRRQHKRLDMIRWIFITWEIGAAATAAWAWSSPSIPVLWLLGIAVAVHLVILVTIILVLVLIPPWRP